jgi:hypothetical protein
MGCGLQPEEKWHGWQRKWQNENRRNWQLMKIERWGKRRHHQ